MPRVTRQYRVRSAARGCLLFVFVLMLAMPAMAQLGGGPMDPDANSIIPSSQSIRSETSFDLFENHWDYMLMPGYLGLFEDDGRVYTQLANLGYADMFQFGMYKPVGPGYLAFKLQGMNQKWDDSYGRRFTDFDVDFSLDPPQLFSEGNDEYFDATGKDEYQAGDVYVAYAWPLTEDSSLGFAIDYAWGSDEHSGTETSVQDPRDDSPDSAFGSYNFPPYGNVFVSDIVDRRDQTFGYNDKIERTDTTFIVEYMKRGDMSWRVRGWVSAVDNDVSSDQYQTDDWDVHEFTDDTGLESLQYDESSTASGIGSFGYSNYYPYEGNGGPSRDDQPGFCNFEGCYFMDNYLNAVAYDGNRYGLEVDLRFEKNPKLHHQLNIGFSGSSFSNKEDTLVESSNSLQLEDFDGEYEDWSSQQAFQITSDDISRDDLFLTWKTRWHLGDTHIGAGAYYFMSEMETGVSGTADQRAEGRIGTDGVLEEGFIAAQLGLFSGSNTIEHSTFSIPVALEQDIGKRLTLRLGSQWLYEMWEGTWDSSFEEGSYIFEDLDPEDPDPIDIEVNKIVLSETASSEFTGSMVRYHAGLAYEFDRVTLEALFSDSWDYEGSSYREGIDFSQIYLGATFKLGGS